MNENRESPPQKVDLTFGTLFKVTEETSWTPGEIHVVTNIGEGSYFYAARLQQNNQGENMISWAGSGTAGAHNIEKIIGILSVDEVILALSRGEEILGIPMPDNIKEIYLKYAQMGSRPFILEH